MPVAKRTATKHVLDHLIPDPLVAETYVHREIYGQPDFDVLDFAMVAQRNVMLFGPTGPGKTTFVKAYCAERKIPYVRVNCRDGIDPDTFFGMMQRGTNGVITYVYSDIMQVIKTGGVLFLDEFNFMRSQVGATFHSLLDGDRMVTILENNNEVIEASPDLLVVIAYNPKYRGTRPLNEASKNRFAIKLEWDYDTDVEEALVGLPVMLDIANAIRARAKEGEIDTPVSTNMLIEFEEMAVELGLAFAISNFKAAFEEEEKPVVGEVLELREQDIKDQLEELKEKLGLDQEGGN